MEQATILREAMRFDIDIIRARYANEHALSDGTAREHERELKRFLAMCAIAPRKRYAMRGPIDAFWHTFLLFTQTYAHFCTHVAGRFIHHRPREMDPDSGAPDREAHEEFKTDYQALFGEVPSNHLWPSPPLEPGPSGAQCYPRCASPCRDPNGAK